MPRWVKKNALIQRSLGANIIAPEAPPMSRTHVGFHSSGFEWFFSGAFLQTYFAGSQYITWLSFSPVFCQDRRISLPLPGLCRDIRLM